MRRIFRFVLLLAVLLLTLVFCPKTAMSEDPVPTARDGHMLVLQVTESGHPDKI